MRADARRRSLAVALFVLVGALAGYALYRVVGCPTGSCPLTGNPFGSTAYGAFIGLVLGTGLLPARD